jgi:Peptidase family M28/PDZ domain
MMLELAEKFALTKGSHPRSIICVAFTGEEEGLLGSKYFVDNPCIDLTKVNAMINLDMVGSLQDSGRLLISGVGTAEGLKELINSENDTNAIKVSLSEEGFGPSDHSSFYRKNIPVLFFWTGATLNYHTPSDTCDKLNYKGMVKISSLVFNVAEKLASSHERLQFREAGPKAEPGRQSRRKGVTIGIMPDFAGNIKNGLRADFVIPGKPAALGGMKKGDIITSVNGKSINNVYDYMSRMGQLKHGETISIEVLRDNVKLVLLIQL